MTRCPICRAVDVAPFITVEGQRYHRCGTCLGTILNPADRLGPQAEAEHYGHHRNQVDDPRYRAFLSRLLSPLLPKLSPGSRCLDFGCGPGPALAAMLREAGHEAAIYDPIFAPDREVLDDTYDAITCTEVVEHFFEPAAEFDRLDRLLRPGGWLGVMTCFQSDDVAFAAWHYRRDPTHVAFYREQTLRHIAGQRGWSFESPAKDIAMMGKPY